MNEYTIKNQTVHIPNTSKKYQANNSLKKLKYNNLLISHNKIQSKIPNKQNEFIV